jgi:hypothetical protein
VHLGEGPASIFEQLKSLPADDDVERRVLEGKPRLDDAGPAGDVEHALAGSEVDRVEQVRPTGRPDHGNPHLRIR